MSDRCELGANEGVGCQWGVEVTRWSAVGGGIVFSGCGLSSCQIVVGAHGQYLLHRRSGNLR